jgi:methylase of polypeptide subunit release factors
VTLAVRFPGWSGVAVDASPAALAVAGRTPRGTGSVRIEFVAGIFGPVRTQGAVRADRGQSAVRDSGRIPGT